MSDIYKNTLVCMCVCINTFYVDVCVIGCVEKCRNTSTNVSSIISIVDTRIKSKLCTHSCYVMESIVAVGGRRVGGEGRRSMLRGWGGAGKCRKLCTIERKLIPNIHREIV